MEPVPAPPISASANAAASAPAIRVVGLTHRYGRPRRRQQQQPLALDHIAFDVPCGEIFGVLGPNGGGKTTLFRILATLLRPSDPAGELSVFGHDVRARPDVVRRQMGVVFQRPALDGKLTVAENLRHHGRLYGLERRQLQHDVAHWLERLGLADRAGALADKLSGGQQRRVELAKALLPAPRLLLMDEPATGLDPGARRDLWTILQTLREDEGVTIALTTHGMDEAERCDRLAILAAGKLVALDSPDALRSQIGGQVIHVEANPLHEDNAAARLASLIAERFGPWEPGGEPRVVDGRIRMTRRHGTAMVSSLSAALPDRIRSISVGQPTLEDVFLDRTGHTFYASEP